MVSSWNLQGDAHFGSLPGTGNPADMIYASIGRQIVTFFRIKAGDESCLSVQYPSTASMSTRLGSAGNNQ